MRQRGRKINSNGNRLSSWPHRLKKLSSFNTILLISASRTWCPLCQNHTQEGPCGVVAFVQRRIKRKMKILKKEQDLAARDKGRQLFKSKCKYCQIAVMTVQRKLTKSHHKRANINHAVYIYAHLPTKKRLNILETCSKSWCDGSKGKLPADSNFFR